MEKQIKKQDHNPWKIAFFSLILVLLFIIVFVTVKAFDNNTPTKSETPISRTESFGVTFNKKQVNGFARYYLGNELKNEPVKYSFILNQHAVVSGTVEFLNQPVQFSLACDPYVLQNGDVQLRAQQIAIGALPLPKSFVLGYIKHNFKLPDWVDVNQAQETINLRLNEFKLANGMQFTAKKIDLKNDQIQFNVFLPLK